MAEYLYAESSNREVTYRLFVESTTGLPTRVEVRGVTNKYRFVLRAADRSRSYVTTFDTANSASRNIDSGNATRFTPTWQIGIEGV